MNPNLQRALLLVQQSRYEMAETELRQALASDPDNSYSHALLAICLCELEKFTEATSEVQQAIVLEPDSGFAHYVHARVLRERRHYPEALAAIQEAIRLDSFDADYFAELAVVEMEEKHWNEALEAAERGLQLDAEHISCTNLRAIALVKLGRRSEAGATIDAALARNPANSITHANQGWTYLEKGEHDKALEHFRESLRLDPENEWARRGIIEALKARHFIYAIMLRYFLWVSRLSSRAQWGIIIGGYIGNNILAGLSRSNPALAPWLLPLRLLYIAFAVLTWLADPVFNLLLRLNKFGRMALTPEQTVASNWVGGCLLLAISSLLACFYFGFESIFLIAALVFGLISLPMAIVFKCASGWPRKVMAGYTLVIAIIGLASLGLFLAAGYTTGEQSKQLAGHGGSTFGIFIIGSFGSQWLANFMLMQRPRR